MTSSITAAPRKGSRPLSLFVRMRTDEEFSLLEAVVAIAIATGIVLALGAALATGIRADLLGRQNQNASDVATQQLEAVRQLPFAAAEMVTTDPTMSSDSLITSGNAFDPGTGTAEPLFLGASGSVNPHIKTVTVNNTPYTVGTYLTVPTDSAHVGANSYYHRLTVVVTWSTAGKPHTRRASTFLVNTQRGLPLPRFAITWVGATSRTQDVGATPYWGFFVRNLGAPDAFNLTASTGAWTYYVDSNANGVRDTGEDTQLGSGSYDFDLNGVPDTGQMQPNSTVFVVAVRNTPIGSSEAGTTSTVTFTATSAAQPTAATASKTAAPPATGASPTPTPSPTGSSSPSPTASPTATPTTTASPAPPPAPTVNGGTIHYYYFHNYVPNTSPSSGASTSRTTMLMDENVPTNTGFYNYSTEQSGNVYGRLVAPGGTDTSIVPSQVADWRYQAPSKMDFNGTATVTVYVLCVGSTGPVTVRASIGQSSDGTSLSSYAGANGTGNATMTSCSTTTWTPLTIGVPLNSSVTNNKWLTVRVYIPNSSEPSIRLLYDAKPSYNAAVAMPQVKP